MRADVVRRGRGDQPGDGGLCKLDGTVLRGLFPQDPWELLRMHVQLVGRLHSARLVQPMVH